MLVVYRSSAIREFESALCTLQRCIDACPTEAWNEPVVNLKFCQVAYHTLFFTDFYLGDDSDSYLNQRFHAEYPEYFRDYEELQDRPQTFLYDRPTTTKYLAHVRAKARDVIGNESTERLEGPSGFPRREFTRAELHLYNTRHIQHHAAQLSLKLRQDHSIAIPWIANGFES